MPTQPSASRFLDDIIENRNGAANLKVVFVDITSYSTRPTAIQAGIIEAFTKCLRSSLTAMAKRYAEYAERNSISISRDTIVLPTGDGAAVCFPFDGLHEIHLQFAKHLLLEVRTHNSQSPCNIFDLEGWCDCHNNFELTIGVSDGKGILYRDVNQAYNVAGSSINLAARVMGLADRSQVIFSEDAYKQLVDLSDEVGLKNKFRKYTNAVVKHGLTLTVYQYVDDANVHLNTNEPTAFNPTDPFSVVLKTVMNKRFGFQHVPLDGFSFEHCDFERSALVFSGNAPFGINHCRLKDPGFVLDGPAALTLVELTKLYRDEAFRPVVESFLEDIRSGVVREAIRPSSIE